jgi:uncharacterized peroxidase-related enzyme
MTTRVPLVGPDKATGKSKEILESVQKAMGGKLPNMLKAMANAPAVLQGYTQLAAAVGSEKLLPKLRHRLAILVAQQNDCTYCMSAHVAMAKAAGLSDDEVSKARKAEADDPKMSAALTFARAIVEKVGGVTDQDWQGVKAAGYSDEEAVEIFEAVALSYFTNIINRGLRTELDFPEVATH